MYLLLYFYSPNSVLSNPLYPTINKNQEIVVHFNNSEQKIMFKNRFMDDIFKNLNTCIDKIEKHCALRVIKRLPSEDFAILTINNKEVKKLRSNIQ